MNTDNDIGNLIPRLSDEIEFYPYDHSNYIIYVPKQGYSLKISTDVYRFLQLVDGTRTINEISDQLYQKHNTRINNDFIHDFLFRKLRRYDVIKSDTNEKEGSSFQSIFRYRTLLLDKKISNKSARAFKFLITDYALPLTILLMTTSLIALLFNISGLVIHLRTISWLSVALYLIVTLVLVLFHELGHAAASGKLGLETRGIGLYSHFCFPVFYTALPGIWKLDNRHKLIIYCGGIYFELILSVLFIILFYAFNDYDFLVITMIIFIRSITNLIPVRQTDGARILTVIRKKFPD